MHLPATGVTLPSSDWKISSVKINKAFSEETTCFTAILTHLPTKCKIWLKNDGRGGDNQTDFDYSHKDFRKVIDEWNDFTEACLPILRESVANEPEEWLRTIWDEKDGKIVTGLADAVIGLFVEEAELQQSFGRRKNAVVRPDASNPREILLYNAPVAVLKANGDVAGEYWDKTVKDWVSF